jgi:hypothetical protein
MPYGHSIHHRSIDDLSEEPRLRSDSPTQTATPQSNTRQGVNLEMVYRSLLNIVAHLDERQYTEGDIRQTEVLEHSDLANPASESTTSQG